MRQKNNKKYKKINKILISLINFSFTLTILAQIYLTFFQDRIVLDELYNNEYLTYKSLDLIPKYGEIKLKINETEKNISMIKILKNGKPQIFIDGILDMQVKDGDLIEFKNYNLEKKIKIKVIFASHNIKNLKNDDIINLTKNKVILIKIS